MLGAYESRLARSERDRAARYHERAERFREIAKMEMQPRARARLLGLAGEYEQLADALAGPEPRRP
jgi:hypothetical protein